MRLLKRPAPPPVLQQHGESWRSRYRAKCEGAKERGKGWPHPHGETYGHAEIRHALKQLGRFKCSYCACELRDDEVKIDHRLPVGTASSVDDAVDRALSWSNLYVWCEGCNNAKRRREDISENECLDPFDAADPPEQHLDFSQATVNPRGGSIRGANTITKFDLARTTLMNARLTYLVELVSFVATVRERCRLEKRSLNDAEHEKLTSYAAAHQPFSLMVLRYIEAAQMHR